jgi:hypothetical protein
VQAIIVARLDFNGGLSMSATLLQARLGRTAQGAGGEIGK